MATANYWHQYSEELHTGWKQTNSVYFSFVEGKLCSWIKAETKAKVAAVQENMINFNMTKLSKEFFSGIFLFTLMLEHYQPLRQLHAGLGESFLQ